MNKNTKSERKRRALKAKNMFKNPCLGWNFTTMRNKKLIYLQFTRKICQNDVHLERTWCSLRSKISKFRKLVKPFKKISIAVVKSPTDIPSNSHDLKSTPTDSFWKHSVKTKPAENFWKYKQINYTGSIVFNIVS